MNTRDGTSLRRVCVVGCGRSHRRDDAVGLRVAAALAAAPPPCTEVIASAAPLTDIMTAWEQSELLVVVDATPATVDLPAGRWVVLDGRRDAWRLRPRGGGDTHGMSVAEALALAGALEPGRGPQVWIVAVAVADVSFGAALTPAVEAAVDAVADAVRSAVVRYLRAPATGLAGANHARVFDCASPG
ncbi:MAG: hydrogenase maturation protease [Phycisphaerae bacterium]